MASTTIMKKHLTTTDVRHRLNIATGILPRLPRFEEGANSVQFRVSVRHGNELRRHVLRCMVRRRGYRKPVIGAGWRQIVREKELREGDLLIFKVDDDGEYILEFRRKIIRLMGRDIWRPV